MPQATWTPLANITLGSSASSVTFSNIPNTYRDLILIYNGVATSSATGIQLALNSDQTTSNYSRVWMNGNGTSATSGTSGPNDLFFGTTNRTLGIANIFDYSATDKHKTVISRDNSTTDTRAVAIRWANTNAVNSVQLYLNGSSFASGAVLSLYGVIA